ncbi:unnamed protein product [Ectocarpus sp. CCAP 1310/34]|nr:unnamed protein product [Ectocarpus sp. CCAP 1310/34]
MSGRRKRPAPAESAACPRPPARLRHTTTTAEVVEKKLLVALVATAFVVAATVFHALNPKAKARLPVHEPRRLDWDEHVRDLRRRKVFRRMYRMDEGCFDKLADLLRPILERNDFYARKRTRHGAVPVKHRLAVALRILAGASYMDVAVLFGIAKETVFHVLWEVVDAINNTPEVGPFFFPQTVEECARQAKEWEAKSTGGAISGCVAAGDGLFVKTIAPSPVDTPNVLSYFSGNKSGYGLNIQATCDANYRFCSMSAISAGATNDWTAWNRSELSRAVARLPPGYYMLGDAAYPLSDQLLTPYPGKLLPRDQDAYNFYLSQLRVKIEQAFGILVGQWGILWRPLRVQFAGRSALITALFRLHNYLRDEQVTPVHLTEEDGESGRDRPALTTERTLPESFQTSGDSLPKPTRSGDVPTRMALRMLLDNRRQYRPEYNRERNNARDS